MIPIVAYGIMGTAYRQELVVDEGAREDGSLRVLRDIRRQLSIQYGDDTPMKGWALLPAPTGIWLSYIERAFDANYAPAYIAISFLIPQGKQLWTGVLQHIEHNMTKNQSKFMQQSVVLHDADWSFLHLLGREVEGMLENANSGNQSYRVSGKNAFWSGDLSSMLQNMWNERLWQFDIVFCGNEMLSTNKEFVKIEGDDIVTESPVEHQKSAEDVEIQNPGDEEVDEEQYEDDVYVEGEEENQEEFEDRRHDEVRTEEDTLLRNNYPADNEKRERIVSKKPSNNIFSFEGRTSRLAYGITMVLYAYYCSVPFLTGDDAPDYIVLAWVLFLVPVLWLLLAQGAKRCHDMGHNGWWQLIPFYGFWMLFKNGELGENKYGPNPKEANGRGNKGSLRGVVVILGILAMVILAILFVNNYKNNSNAQIATEVVEEPVLEEAIVDVELIEEEAEDNRIMISAKNKLFLCLTWNNVKDNGKKFDEMYCVTDEALKARTSTIISKANRVGKSKYEKVYKSSDGSFDSLEQQLHDL